MSMPKQRQSYFAEMQMKNNQPHFFAGMRNSDIRKSVKRIILDVKSNNIAEHDYHYFLEPNVFTACLYESGDQSNKLSVTYRAINNYVTDALNAPIPPYRNINVAKDREIGYNILPKLSSKSIVWDRLAMIFNEAQHFTGELRIAKIKEIQMMDFDANNL